VPVKEGRVLGRLVCHSHSILSTHDTTQDDADVAIYDEVSEDRYKAIVKGRLQQDDFVVDDGATGYMDDGHDDWIGGGDSAPESDDDSKRHSKRAFFMDILC
jgi:hypothetical protein